MVRAMSSPRAWSAQLITLRVPIAVSRPARASQTVSARVRIGRLGGHPGLDDRHLLQGGDRRGGLALLLQALHRVEQRQQDQQQARAELLERVEAADVGREQHELHRVAVLAEERAPARLCLADGEHVRAEPLRPRGRLGRAETALPVHPFGAQDLIGAERVPRHHVGRWRPSRSRCIRHSRRHVDSFLPSSRW
jgi:hypothetical protein